MKNKILNPSELVEGQKLWDLRYDEVTFIKFSKDKNDRYPIKCNRNDYTSKIYTVDGKSYESDSSPVLHLSNPIEQVNEFPKLMEVQISSSCWSKRIVLMKNKYGNYLVIDYIDDLSLINEACSTSFYAKEKVREIQEPIITEYTLEEITTKLGVDVNSIRIKK